MSKETYLKPNKKYKELSQRQKDGIAGDMQEETLRFFQEQGRMPCTKEDCEIVIGRVYRRIEERGIWIPYRQVYLEYRARKRRRIVQNLEKDREQQNI